MPVQLTAANGQLVDAQLQVVERGRRLRVDAALSWRRMLRDGMPAGCLRSAYRTRAEQLALYRRHLNGGNLAARPGQSFHGEGTAADVDPPARLWVAVNGRRYGWVAGRVRGEPWHMEYDPALDEQPAATPPAAPPAAPPLDDLEDDDMLALVQLLYRHYLDRAGSPAEWLSWTDLAGERNLNAKQLHAAFRSSPAEVGTVRSAYRLFLGRGPDPSGLAAWSDGDTIDQVWAGVAGSPEAKARLTK